MNYYKYTREFPEGLQILSFLANLREEITLSSLDPGGVSGITNKYKTDRLTDPENNSDISVIEATWDEYNDTIDVFFNVTPTEGGRVTVLTPSATEYTGSFYNVMFRFEHVSDFLGEKEDFNKVTGLNAFKKMMREAPVKVHSNDPSFFYQGSWESVSKKGGTIFPFPGPAGDGVWKARHDASGGLADPDIYITKHMAQVIESLDNFAPEVLSKLDKGREQVTKEVAPIAHSEEPEDTYRPTGKGKSLSSLANSFGDTSLSEPNISGNDEVSATTSDNTDDFETEAVTENDTDFSDIEDASLSDGPEIEDDNDDELEESWKSDLLNFFENYL